MEVLEEEATERRRVEQALLDSEERYRALVEASRGLICGHDLEGTLLMVNPAAAALGYTPDELVGTDLRELLAPAVRSQFPRVPRPDRPGSPSRRRESCAWSPVPARSACEATPTCDSRSPRGGGAALRRRSREHRGAREINNPLAIIVGQLEMLRQKLGPDPAFLARFETATEAVRRISDIVGKMGRIARLERLPASPSVPPLLDLHRSGGAGPPAPPASGHTG